MNKTATLALFLLAGCGLAAHAQTVEELKIKNRSTFDAFAAGARNPFWPVGWRKEAAGASRATATAAVAAPVEVVLRPQDFVVTSISVGALPLAVINGKAYGEGDLIPLSRGKETVSVQVFAIRDGEVTLRHQTKTVVCTISTAVPSKDSKSKRK